ncbi:MAG TPA: ABC transporter ATP-binding protein [Mycobacteriales bacterium]|nr:ABC transporter ATP-binding protein [Mycobacteriales bacterium]
MRDRTSRSILRASPGRLLVLTVLSLAGGLVTAVSAVALQRLVDAITGSGSGAAIGGYAAAIVGASLLGAGAPQVDHYLQGQIGRIAGARIVGRLYERVGQETGVDRLEDPAYQDRLALAGDAAAMAPQLLLRGGLGLATAAVTAGSLALVLLGVAWPLALLALAGAVPLLAIEVRLARLNVSMLGRLAPIRRRREAYRSLICNPVAGKELRLFGLGDFFRHRMLADLDVANRHERDLERTTLRMQLVAAGVVGAMVVVAVAVVARGATSGATSAGQVVAVVTAFGGLTGALTGAVQALGHLRSGRHLAAAVDEVCAPAAAGTPAAPAPPLRRGVRLEDVWFRYRDDLPWILRGVSLTIPAGGSVALVGLNGTGKSTLVKLLCRLYEPTRGRITWDGADLAGLDPSSLRDRIGAVFQDFATYDLTAAQNVGVGRLAQLQDRPVILAAARRAGIEAELAALPRGLDTMLSRLFYRDPEELDDADTPLVLSGGQWQRVALARMLMRADCDLLLLDEPSSGLDARAEHELHRAVAGSMVGGARVLISHRLSTVRHAERIYVLAGGRVAESGSHRELMGRPGGHYAELFTLQAAGYADPDDGAADAAAVPARAG